MKTCNACGVDKPHSDFHKNSETPDGYRYTCKLCRTNKVPTNRQISMTTRKRQDPVTRKSYGSRKANGGSNWAEIKRMDKYGLTTESFNELLVSQSGRCAICNNPLNEKFCIDHCHSTGAVRGLLCYPCNTGIGMLGDTADGVRRALAYLTIQ